MIWIIPFRTAFIYSIYQRVESHWKRSQTKGVKKSIKFYSYLDLVKCCVGLPGILTGEGGHSRGDTRGLIRSQLYSYTAIHERQDTGELIREALSVPYYLHWPRLSKGGIEACSLTVHRVFILLLIPYLHFQLMHVFWQNFHIN